MLFDGRTADKLAEHTAIKTYSAPLFGGDAIAGLAREFLEFALEGTAVFFGCNSRVANLGN